MSLSTELLAEPQRGPGLPTEIVVVPHTHWDREWYEPHDIFRLRLVHMIDRLLDTLEVNPAYRFTLDGQAAAIDDYLEMRPTALPRVRDAVERGQLALGPFLILLDEFCCDGETIIRNLELGRRSSARLGSDMRVGYLPDMFGHAAQMPQILRGFGIRDAVLWRGVPGRVDRHAFAWRALDGAGVRCEYLFDGYGNALDLFALTGRLSRLAAEYTARIADWYQGDPVLGMLGTDHSAPPPDLVQTVNRCNAAGEWPRLRIATIEQYVRAFKNDDEALAALPQVTGELRSHARGNLLPGVFSIRTNLKQAMARTERVLTVAERLDAGYGRLDHSSFLDAAWYRLIESTAHDSVTGCGVDVTADQVGGRIATAGHLGRGVTDEILRDLAHAVPADAHLVVNPSAFARRAHVEVTLTDAADGEIGGGVQPLSALPTVLGDETMTTAELPKILRRIHGRELFGQQINGYRWGERALRFEVAEAPVGVFDLAAFTDELGAAIASDPTGRDSWHVETIAAPRRRAILGVDIGGGGAAVVSGRTATASREPVTVTERSLANGRLTATVHDDGTVRIEAADGTVLERALRLVDEGDRGDSYNFGPVDSGTVAEPDDTRIEVLERGPLRGRIRVERRLLVPARVEALDRSARSSQLRELVVVTVVELREGERMLRVEVDVVNMAEDHRLRLHIPTAGRGLASSVSGGQYGVTERGRTAEGGWGEFPLPTFPATRFAAAGRATVFLDKLTEFEVVDGAVGDEIALTLVRAVGLMSVNVHPLRDEPAGSEFPVPGAQYLGTRVAASFAVLPSAVSWTGDGVLRDADLFRLPPVAVRGTGGADAPAVAPVPAVAVETRGNVPLESLRRVVGADGSPVVEARFVNYLPDPRPLAARAEGRWDQTDLTGAVTVEGIDLAEHLVGSGEILTLRRRG